MTESPNQTVSRRDVLKHTTTGALAVGGLLATDSASAQQGGVAYLKERHLYGQNNPGETRYKIVGTCDETTIALDCESRQERTYARYQIRCPNFPGGGPGEDSVGQQDHDDGSCPGHDSGSGGGGCGRHILVNPNRRLDTGLTQLYEFTAIRSCGDEYVKAAFRPVR
jgi:hypothetical protein